MEKRTKRLTEMLLKNILCVAIFFFFRYVDDVISRIGRMFPDMSIELFRPNGTSAVLLVRTHARTHTCTSALPRELDVSLPVR